MAKLTFEDGIWWAVETLINNYEESAGELLFKESGLSKNDVIKLAKKSGIEIADKTVHYLDEWIWKTK